MSKSCIFAYNIGITKEVIAVLKECYVNNTAVSVPIHEQMMKYFRQYLVAGWMPEAVQTFVSEEDFQKVVKIQKSIIDNYRNDISKYAGKDKVSRAMVFCRENLFAEGRITYYPFYMAMFLSPHRRI